MASYAKHLAVIEEFAADAVFIGSEADEVEHRLNELRSRFEAIFAPEHVIRFERGSLSVSSLGDTGWFSAFGQAVIVGPNGDRHLPYRLTGVLGWRDGRWRWRQFHGSEPA